MVRFYYKEDYLKVLERGPSIVLGHYLVVRKWKSNFKPSIAKVSFTFVWIRLPGLPMEFFNEQLATHKGG